MRILIDIKVAAIKKQASKGKISRKGDNTKTLGKRVAKVVDLS